MADAQRYRRATIRPKDAKDRKVRGRLTKLRARADEAAERAAQAELLRTETRGSLEADGIERTFNFQQAAIRRAVDVATAAKGFELALADNGAYRLDFTRNGRQLLLGSEHGHVSTLDWQQGNLHGEIRLGETVRAVRWLHNDTMYAVAQTKYVYLYDRTGMELHCLNKHIHVTSMEFLPYHFLLATAGNAGYLKYQDTSTGALVAELRTRLGPVQTMKQNPWNAVLHLGHTNGTVTLWSPNMSSPLVKMLTHRGPLRSIAIDREGRTMVTAGLDRQLKIWDLRTYKQLHAYFTPTPPAVVDISESGLLAVGWGPHVSVWKDALKRKQQSPYMTHLSAGSPVCDLRFCPYEDILGVGHASGYSSLIIPGAGEPNFDAFETNPYESIKQRRENEVRSLLNKIQPEMITLDPDVIGTLNPKKPEPKESDKADEADATKIKSAMEPNPKTRGKNSALRRHLRKKAKNVIDSRRERIEMLLAKEKAMRAANLRRQRDQPEIPKISPALERFKKRT